MSDRDPWIIQQDQFDPRRLHHDETILTIGNGYLSTRGAFEEGWAGDRRATFIHGVFDAAPIGFTELANAPDWLPLTIHVDGERFGLERGTLEAFERQLDLRCGLLSRRVRWRSPGGRRVSLTFERFTSLAEPHLLMLRCRITPESAARIEVRAGLNGNTDNDGLKHWLHVDQGRRNARPGAAGTPILTAGGEVVYLHNRTRYSGIDCVTAQRLVTGAGLEIAREFWDVDNQPTLSVTVAAEAGQEVVVEKYVSVFTSRDVEAAGPIACAVDSVQRVENWEGALAAHRQAWQAEWERTDVEIEGDDEAQIALRFNLFQMLIAAPRHDDRVNIGAKTLSGFGYRGHAFWDTEIFMLPLFTYTSPHIARNLLNYRYRNLTGAREKARANGYSGAQFPWESADTGEEVTPTWVPHFGDTTRLVRIWTGDIEIHISADIAYAAYQYWQVTGDDQWLIDKGAEIILDTAQFWAARAQWNAAANRYEYTNVIGPDEYHDHVDNNAFTNRMAKWNLDTAREVLAWLQTRAPERAAIVSEQLNLTLEALKHWRDVSDKIYLPVSASGLWEQFAGYYKRREVDLPALEPRTRSIQEIFGIEGANETQVIKQPDVLMLQYLLREHFSDDEVRTNYDYYTPRTDHAYGSSLGPSIQAIMACDVGRPDEAYAHFIRAVRADLRDVRGNAGDGIHAASAAGTWQAVVFGFGGLRVTREGWSTHPRLPAHWKRLVFRFMYRGQPERVSLTNRGD